MWFARSHVCITLSVVKKPYSIVWGQSSKPIWAKLVALKYFKDFDDPKDSATLLIEIKVISYEYKWHSNPYLAPDDAKTKLYSHLKKSYDSNTLHYNTFQTLVEVVEHHDGTLYDDQALVLLEIINIDKNYDPDDKFK